MNERISTGIPGLDNLLQGGFLKGSTVLISGTAGAGKTIFCSQFIWEGLKRGENCLFITLEETPEDIIGDVAVFGWDFKKYIEEGKLIIEFADPFELTDIITPLMEKIKKNNISRVALDSTSVLGLYFERASEIRKQLYKLVRALKKTGVTALLTAEIPEGSRHISRFAVEEFVVDGVIVLHAIGEGMYRSLQIKKMRRTNHSHDIHSMKITENGIVIVE